MARYKHYDYRQTKLVPISFERQILPGTFEYALSRVVDEHIDMSVFDSRYRNDETGARAYSPVLLIKIILFAYSRGITSSRQIEQLCRDHVLFIALSADTTPHFTTIANFVSTSSVQITRVFRDVLMMCDEAGLIGKGMFAIDGVKLPSNASKEWSGTKADLQKKADKMQHIAVYLLKQHRKQDRSEAQVSLEHARKKQINTLNQAIAKVKGFLATHDDKIGKSGKPKQSNITDNDSAKIPSSKGVVQGYNGIAMVDAKHQIVIHAEAHGEGQENGLLQPMIKETHATLRALGCSKKTIHAVKLTADAGYSSEANAKYLFEHDVDAYVADTYYRKRDPRFKDAARHKPTKPDAPFAKPKKPKTTFVNTDFQLAKDHSHCICPAGKRMERCATLDTPDGFSSVRFRGTPSVCRACPLRTKCIRHPERTTLRQVAFFFGRAKSQPEKYLEKMKRKIDTEHGRHHYSRRLGIVEPVFANIRSTHRLNRFSLRGRTKVNAQWQLFCLVHNIGKIQRYGMHVMTGKRTERRKSA